jgi:hypothetical protein
MPKRFETISALSIAGVALLAAREFGRRRTKHFHSRPPVVVHCVKVRASGQGVFAMIIHPPTSYELLADNPIWPGRVRDKVTAIHRAPSELIHAQGMLENFELSRCHCVSLHFW